MFCIFREIFCSVNEMGSTSFIVWSRIVHCFRKKCFHWILFFDQDIMTVSKSEENEIIDYKMITLAFGDANPEKETEVGTPKPGKTPKRYSRTKTKPTPRKKKLCFCVSFFFYYYFAVYKKKNTSIRTPIMDYHNTNHHCIILFISIQLQHTIQVQHLFADSWLQNANVIGNKNAIFFVDRMVFRNQTSI